MKKQLNHLLINTAIENLEREGKSVNLTNLAKETGYTYHELYFSSYKHITKKKTVLVKPAIQPSIFPPNLKLVQTKQTFEPIHLHYKIGERELIVHIEKPDSDNFDDAIEDLEFMLTKAIANLKRMKAKSEE